MDYISSKSNIVDPNKCTVRNRKTFWFFFLIRILAKVCLERLKHYYSGHHECGDKVEKSVVSIQDF